MIIRIWDDRDDPNDRMETRLKARHWLLGMHFSNLEKVFSCLLNFCVLTTVLTEKKKTQKKILSPEVRIKEF